MKPLPYPLIDPWLDGKPPPSLLVVPMEKQPPKGATLFGEDPTAGWMFSQSTVEWCMPFVAPFQPGDIVALTDGRWCRSLDGKLWREDYFDDMYNSIGEFPSRPTVFWQPASTMPPELARATVRILEVLRPKQVQDITEDECYAFGLQDIDRGCKGAGCVAGEIIEVYESIKEVLQCEWDRWWPNYPWDNKPWAWMLRAERTEA